VFSPFSRTVTAQLFQTAFNSERFHHSLKMLS
jgi:hypothetical protein